MTITDAQRKFNELSSGVYTATLTDENGDAVPASAINSLKLTLKDVDSGTIINSRDRQDVLNTNNVTVHATSGLLTWTIQPADNAIVSASKADGDIERHLAVFELVFSTTKRQNHRVELEVISFTAFAD